MKFTCSAKKRNWKMCDHKKKGRHCSGKGDAKNCPSRGRRQLCERDWDDWKNCDRAQGTKDTSCCKGSGRCEYKEPASPDSACLCLEETWESCPRGLQDKEGEQRCTDGKVRLCSYNEVVKSEDESFHCSDCVKYLKTCAEGPRSDDKACINAFEPKRKPVAKCLAELDHWRDCSHSVGFIGERACTCEISCPHKDEALFVLEESGKKEPTVKIKEIAKDDGGEEGPSCFECVASKEHWLSCDFYSPNGCLFMLAGCEYKRRPVGKEEFKCDDARNDLTWRHCEFKGRKDNECLVGESSGKDKGCRYRVKIGHITQQLRHCGAALQNWETCEYRREVEEKRLCRNTGNCFDRGGVYFSSVPESDTCPGTGIPVAIKCRANEETREKCPCASGGGLCSGDHPTAHTCCFKFTGEDLEEFKALVPSISTVTKCSANKHIRQLCSSSNGIIGEGLCSEESTGDDQCLFRVKKDLEEAPGITSEIRDDLSDVINTEIPPEIKPSFFLISILRKMEEKGAVVFSVEGTEESTKDLTDLATICEGVGYVLLGYEDYAADRLRDTEVIRSEPYHPGYYILFSSEEIEFKP